MTFVGPGEGRKRSTWLGDELGLLAGAAWGGMIVVRTSRLAGEGAEKLLFYEASGVGAVTEFILSPVRWQARWQGILIGCR